MTPPASVDFDMCARANAFGTYVAGTLSDAIITRQISMPQPFRDRVEKVKWQDGVGYTNNYLTFNPRMSEAMSDDELIPFAPGDTSNLSNGFPGTADCQLPFQELPLTGIVTRSFALGGKRFKSPLFCAKNLQTRFQAEQTINFYADNLEKQSSYFVERNVQAAYTRISDHKIIATDSPSTGASTATDGVYATVRDADGNTLFPPIAPNTILVQGILDRIKAALNFEVSSAPNMDTSSGRMVYDLMTDDMTSTLLVNAQGGQAQLNYQLAYQGQGNKSPLIQGIGAYMGTVVNGFRHIYLKYPARWDLVNGQWVRIRPFAQYPADPNRAQYVTQEYLNAPFQDSYVFLTNVMKMAVRNPVKRIGNAVFNTPITDYAGDQWQWFNQPGVEGCNIDGSTGFWWTEFGFGFMKVDPRCGYVIRHRNCNAPINAFNCGANFVYGQTTDYGYGYAG